VSINSVIRFFCIYPNSWHLQLEKTDVEMTKHVSSYRGILLACVGCYMLETLADFSTSQQEISRR